MNLYIDTTEYGRVSFGLPKSHPPIKFGASSEFISGSKSRSRNKPVPYSETGFKMTSQSFSVTPQESDKVLEILEKFLKKSEIRNPKSEIEKIILYKGAGSFTGLRVGAAIADALSLAWQVPVKIASK